LKKLILIRFGLILCPHFSVTYFAAEISGLYALIGAEVKLLHLKYQNATVPMAFKRQVQRKSKKIAFYYEDKTWTFHEFDMFTNQIANHFQNRGYKPGDEVALVMESTPVFVAFWLGLAKAGIVPALINNTLKLDSLAHSINVIDAKAIIFDTEMNDAVSDVIPLLRKRNLEYFYYGDRNNTSNPYFISIREAIRVSSTGDVNYRGNFTDRLFYIYTSGTSGFPKASNIKHSRYFMMGITPYYVSFFHHNDIIYNCLPLYHSVGGGIGTCQTLILGLTSVVRKKFSATKFWDDCIKHRCTVALYIGELCRYLLSQPESKLEKNHSVRLIFGNGLRTDIWRSVRERFQIKKIVEFYGNVTCKAGACGFMSMIAPDFIRKSVYPLCLIKVREDTEEPIRDKWGLCVRCEPGETGLLVSLIKNKDPIRSFDGYVNTEETKKKIVRDVFARGDEAFASGDLFFMDTLGYLYFKDRIGDTFRWKGHNVSTTEVESIISNVTGLADSVVFGVEVANCEGRAGMAVIMDSECNIDVNDLLLKLKQCLPTYSIPIFIRLVKKIETTGTFKLIKTVLKKEAYNVKQINDRIYFLNSKVNRYQVLQESYYEDIINGQIKF
ncbi:Long-chain fatty acid transport protein 1-like protein, partial [Leptotrombidium deliense]